MKQYIIEGTDGHDDMLYVVRAMGANGALKLVAGLSQTSPVRVKVSGRPQTRVFLCHKGLTSQQFQEQIEANPLGEAGRGCYEVSCKELVENVNLA